MIRTTFSNQRHLAEVPSGVVAQLRRIDLAQGRLGRLLSDAPVISEALAARSRINSVVASNELEGVRTTQGRAAGLVRGDIEAINRDEHEIAGYRAALDDVFARPRDAVTAARLLHWHRELFRYAGPDVAGRFKRFENRVVNPDGTERFRTVPASDVEDAVRTVAADAQAALIEQTHHPVLVTASFTLDLLVIHPFEDGNGRTARIASNAMLMGAEYVVGRFMSIEQLLSDRRTAYYESLRRSTIGWHGSEHSVWPWAQFFTEVVADAYHELDQGLHRLGGSDRRTVGFDWLRAAAPTTFSISDAQGALAGLSPGTIRSVLHAARDAGALELRGAGRGSRWVIVDRNSVP